MEKLFWPLKLLIVSGILLNGQNFSLATRPDVTPEECAEYSKVRRLPRQGWKLTSCKLESGQLEILVVRYAVKGADAASSLSEKHL